MARHEFALFISQQFARGVAVIIHDPESLRRLTSIVRLREGETVQLFNREESIRGTVTGITKKQIELDVNERFSLQSLKPSLTILLPTLKKDDCEEALSRLCALGVTTIQFVETEKVQHSWQFERERDRFERVMIAAAEQSKQFILPDLLAPISLKEALKEVTAIGHKIFFDPDGEKLMVSLERLVKTEGAAVLFVGPEGDLTDDEKMLIRSHGFIFCSLTPTILRACEAIALGAGVVRSIVRQ